MRWIFRILWGLLVLAVVAVGSLFLLPSDRVARIAAQQIEAQTGRAVSLSGDTRISIWPVLGIATGKMSIANAPWSTAGPMMEADSLKVGVEMAALLQGSVRITGIEAQSPVIRLETSEQGRVNWRLGVEGVSPSGQPVGASNPLALTLDRALVTDASVSFTDYRTGSRTAYSGVDFEMHWPDAGGAADFVLTLSPGGTPVTVTATVGDFAGFVAGRSAATEAEARLAGGVVRFSGSSTTAPALSGRVSANLPDTGAALAALGLGRADIPRGLGRALTMQAALTLAGGRAALDDLALGLDENALTGALAVTLEGTPRVTGQLTGGALDFRALAASDGAGGGKGDTPGGGWSKTTIDAGALAAANAEVTLAAQSVDLGQFKLGETRIVATNDRSRTVFDIRQMQAYGGQISGDFVLNNRTGLSVGGRLRATDVDVQALLDAAAGIRRFKARGDARVEFLGVGASLDAIMRSLRGDGGFSTGRGVIDGIDLDRLMRGDMTTGGTTVFDAMTASFAIVDGVLRNDDLSMSLPFATATGAGRIDLGAQTLDYTVTPVSLQARDGRGLAVPVRARGPWADPKISIDLERAVKQNFEEEIDAAKDEARQKVEERVGKELGVTAEEGQSLEDAVKEELEDRLKKGLGKLFE